MGENIITILQHTIFDILLPTSDAFGDIKFAISAFYSQNPGIGCLMILPVVLNTAFTFYKWFSTDHDTQKEKRFTWLLVVLNLWPQYQVLKLILLILREKSKDIWEPVQDKIKREISFIEPFVEAIPQFFVSAAVFNLLIIRSRSIEFDDTAAFFGLSGHIWEVNEIKQVFGATTLGIDNKIMFPLSMMISTLSGVKSIVDYLSNGPMKMTSDGKCGKAVVLLSMLMYVLSCFAGKSCVLSLIVQIAEFDIHVMWIFLISITILIVFPILISIGPLSRVVGFRTCTKMFFNHPELFVLPLVTEYTPGPIDGAEHYSSCCRCCNCWSCCTWSSCCKQCKPVKTNKINISTSMSWNRMLYNQVIMLPQYTFYIIYVNNSEFIGEIITPELWWLSFSSLILYCLGLVCFGITLHYANSKSMVLMYENKRRFRGVENENLELQLQQMMPQYR